MPIPVTIQSQTYEYPSPGDQPGWGEDATDAFVALVTKVNGISPNTDIVAGSASIANNQSSPVNVTTLIFDSGVVGAAIIEYHLTRTVTGASISEQGTLSIDYSNGVWYIQRELSSGVDTGVVFSITNAGQIQMTSSNIAESSYVGNMSFRARTFPAP
jgi:hypothetical protein